ncbi:MAG: hypothetical protein LBD99_06585 [Candidatus Margulisbacteria bacterium]|nr:hypothetical protein [Candidatus Margulisiibacteriota bacterium]
MEEKQELDERVEHLKDVQAFIDDLITNKNIIQNIVILYDFKCPDRSTDISFNYVGNFNAVVGMMERHKNIMAAKTVLKERDLL